MVNIPFWMLPHSTEFNEFDKSHSGIALLSEKVPLLLHESQGGLKIFTWVRKAGAFIHHVTRKRKCKKSFNTWNNLKTHCETLYSSLIGTLISLTSAFCGVIDAHYSYGWLKCVFSTWTWNVSPLLSFIYFIIILLAGGPFFRTGGYHFETSICVPSDNFKQSQHR